ncbi:MAG TPA: NAD(P)/FAD-dependent oxidoreductase [Blastocatellia bacterium]|nr:NAD(P)/FAD-dependent oxidoreductase [Blastocatellia bacterium]
MPEFDAIVVGGGPGGCSAAISLAQRGARVLLLEEKHMPRGKLCGEFVTPESFPTLERLGVMQRMISAGAQKIERASLVVSSGKSVQTYISKISENGTWAMSLSRSRFDQILFDRAREAGVECREGVAVKRCLFDSGAPRGVETLLLPEGASASFEAPVIIDASGRNSRLMLGKRERVAGPRGSRLYAMKAHLDGVQGIEDQVELHFFRQGYGGFSRVEGGLVNLCFIVDERTLRRAAGDPLRVLEICLISNKVARDRLEGSKVVGKWYSAGPLTFGRKRLGRDGVLAIGDASGMIDPFTGTGIQMALRTGELAAETIIGANGEAGAALKQYALYYEHEFGDRLKAAGRLRGLAFSPKAARLAAGVLARVPGLTSLILRATRTTSGKPG